MELVVAVILVCGLLNLIPWFLLIYTRPDLDIAEKVDTIDTGLAQVANILFEKLESLEDLGSSVASSTENPLISFLTQMMNRNMENNLYGRSSDGTFDGTKEIIEAESSPNDLN